MGEHNPNHPYKPGDRVEHTQKIGRLGTVHSTTPQTGNNVNIKWDDKKGIHPLSSHFLKQHTIKEEMKTQDIVKAASKKDGLSLKKLVHEVLATKVVAALDAERRVVAAQYFGEDVESIDENDAIDAEFVGEPITEGRPAHQDAFTRDQGNSSGGRYRLVHVKTGKTVATGSKKFVTAHHDEIFKKHATKIGHSAARERMKTHYQFHSLAARHKNQVAPSGKHLPEF